MALNLDDLNDDVLYILLQWIFAMAGLADPTRVKWRSGQRKQALPLHRAADAVP